MIGEAAGLLGNPIVSTLVGFIPDIVDWIGKARYHFEKSRCLGAFVKEYACIADVTGCPTVARLIRTKGVIDELDAGCDGSMSKEALVNQLLSNASIPQEECAAQSVCQQFVSDYFDAKTWIDDEKMESATARVGEQVVSGFEGVNDKLDRIGGDIAAWDHAASLVLNQVVSGSLTFGEAREYVRLHGRDDLTGRMLGLYCDALAGERIDGDGLRTALSFPRFTTFLAGCMVSVWRLDGLEQLASLADGDLCEDLERILPILRREKPLASVCGEDSVLEGFHDDDLAMLCIAEFAYYERAFDVASWHFRQCSEPLNEVAKLHRKATELVIALMNTHVVTDDVKSLVESIPRGMVPAALDAAIDVANLGMALLMPGDFAAVYGSIDDDGRHLCEQASSWQRLEGCTVEEAWSILRQADERGHYDVFLEASDRLIADPNESEKLRRYWRGQTNMLCNQYALLEFYLSRVEPEITAEDAEQLVADRRHDPVFQLTLAEHFEGRDEACFKRCVERAIAAMEDREHGTVDIAHTHVWVPYLVKCDRLDEIFAILAPIGVLPERASADLVSLLWRNGVDQEAIEGFIDDHAVWRHVSQPRSFYIFASHCLNAGDYETAAALGTKSFEGQETVQAARLVANAGNLGYQQVSRRIVDWLVSDDKPMSLYLAAGQYRIAGEDDLADDLLVRAVLLGGEGAAQSAAALAGEWAGGAEEDARPNAIGKNCAVSYVAEDGTRGTIVFHERRRRVPNGRHAIGNKIHLTTRSPEFVALEGKGLGNTRCRRLGRIEVVEIESVEAHMLRLCFKLMTELPDVTALTLGDDPIETISGYLKAHEETTRPIVELVKNGIAIKDGPTIYPGISAGSTLLGQSHLEYAFRAIKDSRMTLHRPLESEFSVGDKAGFLLSASSIIMIAVADLGRECEELLCRSSVVTETTRNLLMREAELFRSQTDRSAGMLFLGSDEKPVLVPMQEEDRVARRDLVARVIEILGCVPSHKTSVEDAAAYGKRRKRHPEIGANESQDWEVCRHDGLTYVTEDALEAIRVVGDETMSCCNLLQALAMMGLDEPGLSRCSVRMHRAGCDPSMGRLQALRLHDLLMRRHTLNEAERETLLNYAEVVGLLDNADG